MGEFKVHRVRFFDYMPSAIRAMAFNSRSERLALARADGAVEVFNFSDNYYQEKVVPGQDGRAVEALCWVGQRLFSAGLNGEITEYDLENLRPKYTMDAYGGPIWTISSNTQGTLLAVGCEDGTVKIFEMLETGIQFQRNLDRQKGRVISLSWHPSGSLIAAGMMDMIRIFDAETGHATHRLLVEKGLGTSNSREVVVWGVVFLSDNTIISGDSAGKVQIWDGLTGTLLHTHLITKWDVLALAVSQDETSLIAGTSEGTVVQFQFLSSTMGQQDKDWVRTRTFKNHSHDVRALVHTDTAVVSGGMDTQLVVRPLLDKVDKNTQESSLRKITFPHKSLVCCAKKAGMLLFQFPDHLEVWRLGDSDGNGKPGDTLPVNRKPEKLIQLNRKGEEHICCSALSPCGGWLAYSTVSSVRLYRLQHDNNNISINKVSKLPKILHSAHQLCFSSDSSKLFASSTNSSVIILSLNQSECKYLHTLKPKSDSRQPIHLLFPSEDGKWLATANTDCEVHVYNLNKLKLHCTVPVYSSCPTAIAIHPTSSNLVTVHADQQMFEYSLVQKEYTDWSRKLQKQGLHPLWLQRDTPITHVTFNPKNPAHIILHDTFMFCIVDQTLPLPEAKAMFHNQMMLRSLPEAERIGQSHAFKICKTFQHLLCVRLLEDHSVVVVERPLLDIQSQLPAPVRQKKFAT
ncbi:U3 small nucleolar RNA-associated protein 4 homolog [Sphaeramia orbicularis]|uniref:Anaphase-promoting complex subunit 4-like WD40 domain-containing protein n=1 Tax=Sphaeramia orbicularis TaxID=375764 RepID=A0A672YH70_9TELE|nr:U3 small nucleolar RNA-associated protein 4 homolog [Sphaeramia orbicularis]XP_029993195.1 U3 small nucleolar RNA-associated protein 4 homolog [Sphaeramia orbicularis]XP_029993196.1 U3 small nucleolar RNA-associated protein 4 homolog [Sphaeramia orbicularis]